MSRALSALLVTASAHACGAGAPAVEPAPTIPSSAGANAALQPGETPSLLPLSERLRERLGRRTSGNLAPPPARELEPLLGEYRDSARGRELMVVERGGELLLIDGSDSLYQLEPTGADLWLAMTDGEVGAKPSEVTLQGERVSFRGITFTRVPFGETTGEVFRIEPLAPVAELRVAALEAQPPAESPAPPRTPELVELTSLEPSLRLEMRYATTDNFMGTVFYQQARAFLQKPAALALAQAQQHLRPQGFGLLIYDAYRPWYVTKMFWDATPTHQREFVANPADGSRHNRGCAIDLTLVELTSGEPVSMPSGYDEFSHRAYSDYPAWSERQRDLRALLTKTLENEGFQRLPNEWWHFDFATWRDYPILNERFEDL
jgi:D-alanyl-D-alanine dipeptidase